MSNMYFGEQGYMQMLKHVYDNGVQVTDRTGVGSIAVFDEKIVYTNNEFPFPTARPAPLRLAFEEFWFFLNGKTQTKELEAKGINFWKGNTTREFLDKRGLLDLPEGDMGKAYGSQLRDFNGTSVKPEHTSNYLKADQLAITDWTLRHDPYARRIYNTMWNPNESKLMALTPCWHSHQFVVLPERNKEFTNTLHLKVVNRSLDSLFGYSYAVQQYRLYQIAMAKLHKMNVGDMSCDITHAHLYINQLNYTKELLERPHTYPSSDAYNISNITITKELNTLEDLLGLTWDDFEIIYPEVNTTPFKTKRPQMAI